MDHLVRHIRSGKGLGDHWGNDISADSRLPALYVVGQLCAFGEVLGLPARAPIAQARDDGCTWESLLSFPLKVSDSLPSYVLVAYVMQGSQVGLFKGMAYGMKSSMVCFKTLI